MYTYTVVIPHHNIPNLLERCLNSIPTRGDIQIIIVDDNSNTDVVDFERFPGLDRQNTKVIFNKEPKGAGHARNLALEHAEGKWLVFADADDFFTQDAFAIMDQYSDCMADLVLFKIKSVMSDTLAPADRDGSMINQYIDGYFNGKYSKERVSFINEAPWAKMVSNELVAKKDIKFDEVRYSNDIMFSTKVTCNSSEIVIAKEAIYIITLRDGSLTFDCKTNPENFLSRMEVKIRRNQYLKKHRKERPFLLLNVIDAKQISLQTAIKTLSMILSKRLLFDGMSYYLRNRKS